MKKIWKARDRVSQDLIAQLLATRGLAAQDAEDFLNPRFEGLLDPFGLKDMDKAAVRIGKALQDQEKITIYADYDADAVTAAAVLLRFFGQLKYANVDYYIPDRFTEGYGVNSEAIKSLAERGTKLIITVDCGINAFDAVDLATYLGIDVIVTDHHQLTGGGIPRAAAVVNPHRPDDSYQCKDLTGVGVAFKLAQALTPLGVLRGWEKWLLDLVAIGTVADCQRLLGENRILVKWGLVVLSKTRWVGLKKLMELARVWQTPLDTYKIGFIIAPRINAAGRIEHANLALELLLTDDEAQAASLAQKLEELNRHRQDLTQQILSEAREQLVQAGDKKVLLVAGSGWPKGIVGLVAGKLTEEFYRPVLVLEKGAEQATGSARSIASFNIVEALAQSREILVRYGGHPMAAGFTIMTEHIELFHKNLLQYAETVLTEDDLSPVLYYDAELILAEVNEDLLNLLEKFAPFGLGNPRPRFRLHNLVPNSVSTVGREGKHLRMHLLGAENQKFGCIGFNLGFWAEKLQGGGKIDIICELQYNDWRGEKTVQLKVVDIDLSGN